MKKLKQIIKETFENISKRFTNWKVSNLRSHNIHEIVEAIFDDDKVTHLLSEGIPSSKLPSYWVFQGNPKKYDIIKSLKENNLTTWSVSAHKKRIKKGDKFILWATGSKLRLLRSWDNKKPMFIEDMTAKKKNNIIWGMKKNIEKDRCDIKIDTSLVDDPIYRTEIKSNQKLLNLKVGFQGTNFSATEEEFDELVKIISDRGIVDPPTKKN